ncbi:PAS domain-containing protein [Halonotius aquaticus]|nr:PAS domain-containing protein [Halonotius aquaticus]
MTDPDDVAAAQQQLFEIIRRDCPFDQKARDALQLGVSYLGVDNGHLTRIDTATDDWQAMVSTDAADGHTPPELELDLRETYCRHAIELGDQQSVPDVSASEWADDPARDTRELGCYLGTPIVLDGEPRGTVCFVAAEGREPFTDADRQFAELLACLLERELERETVATALTNQTTLATVLNRVLRHNLRNEMSVIRGFTQLMAADTDTGHDDTVFEHIDDLLQLSEKARELERIVTSDADRTTVDIVALVDSLVDAVDDDYPAASISVIADGSITTAVLPSFERALMELLDNAAKHGGDAPTITVTVETVPDAVEIEIVDDGPGLSEQEIDVLDTGTETPFTHGSGLGLWLAHWIVSSHDGTIDAMATDAGTVMTVSVPQKPAMKISHDLPELTRARDTYRAAVEGACDAIVVVTDDGRIVEANPAAGELFGADRTALLGRVLTDFFAEGVTVETIWADPDLSERATVTAVDDAGWRRIIEYTATPEIVTGHHLFVGRDVTEQVAREAELARKTQAMDEAPIGIVLTDPTAPDNPIIYVNDAFCELTGYTAEEMLGQNCRFLQGPATDDQRVAELSAGIENRESTSVTLRNYRADGTPFWNHITIVPVASGDDERMVGFQEDVTDRIDRPVSPAEPPNSAE